MDKGFIAKFLPDVAQPGFAAVFTVAVGVEYSQGCKRHCGDMLRPDVVGKLYAGFRLRAK